MQVQAVRHAARHHVDPAVGHGELAGRRDRTPARARSVATCPSIQLCQRREGRRQPVHAVRRGVRGEPARVVAPRPALPRQRRPRAVAGIRAAAADSAGRCARATASPRRCASERSCGLARRQCRALRAGPEGSCDYGAAPAHGGAAGVAAAAAPGAGTGAARPAAGARAPRAAGTRGGSGGADFTTLARLTT